MQRIENKFLRVVLIALAVIAGIALFGGVVMWLWNNTLAQVAPVKPVTYWQALGILVLSKILFGVGGKSHYRKRKCKKNTGTANDEERQRMKDEWRERCRTRSWWKKTEETASAQSQDTV